MPRWTLENLIDFEQALAVDPRTDSATKTAVTEAAGGLDGPAARRAGLHVWLVSARREPPAGKRFTAALTLVRVALMIFGFGTGAGLVSSLMNHGLGGMNVVVFLAAAIGVQWLILAAGTIGWMFRRNATGGLTLVQSWLGGLLRKITKENENSWWSRLVDGGSAPRAALLWRLGGLAQVFGIWFNLGIIGVLAVFVLTRNVGFYWESTTDEAMRGILIRTVDFLSLPWSAFWPDAVPGPATIDATRLLPDQTGQLAPGPRTWWLFLLAATFVWGLLPRIFLWLQAGRASNRALGNLDFQARHHRALWRELTGTTRIETDEKPLDGVLVLDVGGSGLPAESLRPFLLRKLRVHPAAWHSTAVLDPGAEREAARALALAPAGVVMFAEGWALSPPRMKALHAKIRSIAGPDVPVKFLAVNESGDLPAAPTAEEKTEWEKFVDSLRDPNAEVYGFE